MFVCMCMCVWVQWSRKTLKLGMERVVAGRDGVGACLWVNMIHE